MILFIASHVTLQLKSDYVGHNKIFQGHAKLQLFEHLCSFFDHVIWFLLIENRNYYYPLSYSGFDIRINVVIIIVK